MVSRGCEAARRTIGLAKVSDLESLDHRAYPIAGPVMPRFSRLLLVYPATVSFDDLDLGLSAIDR